MCVYMHSRFVENHPIRILEDEPLIFEGVLSHVVLARWIEGEATEMARGGEVKKLRCMQVRRGVLGFNPNCRTPLYPPLPRTSDWARPLKPWAGPSSVGARKAWATLSLLFFNIFLFLFFLFFL
jgi:hypothetical protein